MGSSRSCVERVGDLVVRSDDIPKRLVEQMTGLPFVLDLAEA